MQPVDRALAVIYYSHAVQQFQNIPHSPSLANIFPIGGKERFKLYLAYTQGYYNTDDTFPNR
jgi:hypothetical protein